MVYSIFYSTKLLVSRNTLDLRGEWGGKFRPHITLADLPKALDVAVVANDRDELREAMAKVAIHNSKSDKLKFN